MPKAPRGKRVADPSGETFRVVNKAPNGEAEPYFDRSRQLWVAPWRKPDVPGDLPNGRDCHRRQARLGPGARVTASAVRTVNPDQTAFAINCWPMLVRRVQVGQVDNGVTGDHWTAGWPFWNGAISCAAGACRVSLWWQRGTLETGPWRRLWLSRWAAFGGWKCSGEGYRCQKGDGRDEGHRRHHQES
jgi:hypothetical protein